jgi:hypothetical protein
VAVAVAVAVFLPSAIAAAMLINLIIAHPDNVPPLEMDHKNDATVFSIPGIRPIS